MIRRKFLCSARTPAWRPMPAIRHHLYVAQRFCCVAGIDLASHRNDENLLAVMYGRAIDPESTPVTVTSASTTRSVATTSDDMNLGDAVKELLYANRWCPLAAERLSTLAAKKLLSPLASMPQIWDSTESVLAALGSNPNRGNTDEGDLHSDYEALLTCHVNCLTVAISTHAAYDGAFKALLAVLRQGRPRRRRSEGEEEGSERTASSSAPPPPAVEGDAHISIILATVLRLDASGAQKLLHSKSWSYATERIRALHAASQTNATDEVDPQAVALLVAVSWLSDAHPAAAAAIRRLKLFSGNTDGIKKILKEHGVRFRHVMIPPSVMDERGSYLNHCQRWLQRTERLMRQQSRTNKLSMLLRLDMALMSELVDRLLLLALEAPSMWLDDVGRLCVSLPGLFARARPATVLQFCRLAMRDAHISINVGLQMMVLAKTPQTWIAIPELVDSLPIAEKRKKSILVTLQTRYGDFDPPQAAAAITFLQPQTFLSSTSSATAQTWLDALRVVAREAALTQSDTTLSELEEEAHSLKLGWRAHLPQAIRLCADVGHHEMALRCFSEYAAKFDEDALSMMCTPSVVDGRHGALHLAMDSAAIAGFAKAVCATGRWYRAVEVLSAIGSRACSVTSSSRDERLTTQAVKHTASVLRHRWEESLALLELLKEEEGTPLMEKRQLSKLGSSRSLFHVCAPYVVESVARMPKRHDHWHRAILVLQSLGAIDACRSIAEGRDNSHDKEVALASLAALTAQCNPKAALATVAELKNMTGAMSIVAERFAALGHWEETLALISTNKKWTGSAAAWNCYTSSLKNAHCNVAMERPWSTNELLDRIEVIPSAILCKDRSLLRTLIRIAENHGSVDALITYLERCCRVSSDANTLEKKNQLIAVPSTTEIPLGREYLDALKARLNSDKDTSDRRVTVTEPLLVHYLATSPWMPQGVRFRWTHRELDKLNGSTYSGDVKKYMERELGLHPSQARGKDFREVPKEGSFMILFPQYRKEEHNPSSSALHISALRSLIVCSRDAATLLIKPAGISMPLLQGQLTAMGNTVALEPLYQMQPGCEGIAVFVPMQAAKVWYTLRLYLILGLRPIDRDAKSLLQCRFFNKYEMCVVQVKALGTLLPSNELVVVEAQCQSNDQGPAGTLYQLSMDLALEGWGYHGDSGNSFAEEALDSPSPHSGGLTNERASLEGRVLFYIREVVMHVPPAAVNKTQELEGCRVVSAEVPMPAWWRDEGLLPEDWPEDV